MTKISPAAHSNQCDTGLGQAAGNWSDHDKGWERDDETTVFCQLWASSGMLSSEAARRKFDIDAPFHKEDVVFSAV